jgi:hypothetical protein
VEELNRLQEKGYSLKFSVPCGIAFWGNWMVKLIKGEEKKGTVMGYGNNESEALVDALKNLEFLENKNK